MGLISRVSSRTYRDSRIPPPHHGRQNRTHPLLSGQNEPTNFLHGLSSQQVHQRHKKRDCQHPSRVLAENIKLYHKSGDKDEPFLEEHKILKNLNITEDNAMVHKPYEMTMSVKSPDDEEWESPAVSAYSNDAQSATSIDHEKTG